MNIFIGKKYTNEELNNKIENKTNFNENDEKYQELLNIVKYDFL